MLVKSFFQTADQRIVGGCNSGHVPWFVQIFLPVPNVSHKPKCGGVIINKFWILSAAHCVCIRDQLDCSSKRKKKINNENKWVIEPLYDISDIEVKVPILSLRNLFVTF